LPLPYESAGIKDLELGIAAVTVLADFLQVRPEEVFNCEINMPQQRRGGSSRTKEGENLFRLSRFVPSGVSRADRPSLDYVAFLIMGLSVVLSLNSSTGRVAWFAWFVIPLGLVAGVAILLVGRRWVKMK
jgi:hypothetical protein